MADDQVVATPGDDWDALHAQALSMEYDIVADDAWIDAEWIIIIRDRVMQDCTSIIMEVCRIFKHVVGAFNMCIKVNVEM